jgi:hypothetical protein
METPGQVLAIDVLPTVAIGPAALGTLGELRSCIEHADVIVAPRAVAEQVRIICRHAAAWHARSPPSPPHSVWPAITYAAAVPCLAFVKKLTGPGLVDTLQLIYMQGVSYEDALQLPLVELASQLRAALSTELVVLLDKEPDPPQAAVVDEFEADAAQLDDFPEGYVPRELQHEAAAAAAAAAGASQRPDAPEAPGGGGGCALVTHGAQAFVPRPERLDPYLDGVETELATRHPPGVSILCGPF